MTCDVCGQPLPERAGATRGRKPKRHKGPCQVEHQRRYYARWMRGEIVPRGARRPVDPGQDLSPAEIERIYAARLREVRGIFTVDPWQQRAAWEGER